MQVGGVFHHLSAATASGCRCEGGYARRAAGPGKSLYFPSNFAEILKLPFLSLKNQVTEEGWGTSSPQVLWELQNHSFWPCHGDRGRDSKFSQSVAGYFYIDHFVWPVTAVIISKWPFGENIFPIPAIEQRMYSDSICIKTHTQHMMLYKSTFCWVSLSGTVWIVMALQKAQDSCNLKK